MGRKPKRRRFGRLVVIRLLQHLVLKDDDGQLVRLEWSELQQKTRLVPFDCTQLLKQMQHDDLIFRLGSGHYEVTDMGRIYYARYHQDFRPEEIRAASLVSYEGIATGPTRQSVLG